MGKLREKKQSEKQRKQAHLAVTLYIELVSQSAEKGANNPTQGQKSTVNQPACTGKEIFCLENKEVEDFKALTNEPETTEKKALKSNSSDWTGIYNDLKNAIKIRHYSPSTLKTYISWTRKFQIYTKSKDSRLLTVEDVKGFLTWLAVEKDVAASSQNQAFNALLFVFRHVLGKEFGKVDGIVRAKRKPYIPVVLSREEVDRIIALLNHSYSLIISLMYGSRMSFSSRS